MYSFIKDQVPKGARILEIGGGDSRVICALKNDYEFWNLDMLKGSGNGPTKINPADGFTLVKDNIGNFSTDLPDHYFDLICSISVVEHFLEDEESQIKIIQDMRRVSTNRSLWVHCIDAIMLKEHIWIHPILEKMINPFDSYDIDKINNKILNDANLWTLPKYAYCTRWRHKTHTPYKAFGYPFSINIVLQNS